MELTGSHRIEADRETVWNAILDPEVLKTCVPGCTDMIGNLEEGFEATVVQKVGPVKATFKGRVTFQDMERPESLTIKGEGKGGAAGFAQGGARVRLSDTGGGTGLDYDVEARVGGKLAHLGGRIIDGFARKMVDRFFTDFKNAVEGDGAPADSEAVGGGRA